MIRLPRRARARLALSYAAMLAGSLLLLGGLGLTAVEHSLRANVDDLLRFKAGAVQTEVDLERNRLVVDLDGAKSADARALTAGLDVVRVWDDRQKATHRFATDPETPDPDPALLEDALNGRFEAWASTLVTASGDPIRMHLEPVRRNNRIVGVVEVGHSLTELEALLARLRLVGGLSSVLALVLGGVGGWVLAGWALAPVDRITRAAERIGAEDLGKRLNLALPDDELGRLARAFDGMIDRLDRAFQRQGQFTADASHELRTPLAVIRSQVDVALTRPREPEYYTRVLGSVRDETRRLEQLTENMLALARADAAAAPSLEPVDLESLVAEMAASITLRTRERGLILHVELAPVGFVRGVEPLLQQLLRNLLDNAVRHTQPGGQITIRLALEDDGAALTVRDTGEGIDPEHLHRVTERFYRADQARGRASGGAGLGLAICQWIAQLHGGALELSSELGAGTAVRVWLPDAASTVQDVGPRTAERAPYTRAEQISTAEGAAGV